MYKNIIFDCFGTLIDTGTGSVEAVREILSNVRMDIDAQVFYAEWKSLKKEMMLQETFYTEKALFAISLGKIFEKYGVNADAENEVKPMIDVLFGKRNIFPETMETLNALEAKGIQYAIGSTTDTDSLMHFLDANNLRVANVFTSESMKVYKPAPLFYRTILQKMNWNVSESIFVGDSLLDDVAGPKSIGMKTVLVDRKAKFSKSDDIEPDYVITNLKELLQIVGG
ncbi:MAG: HAD family hydrolase [Eubacterium sp.]|nr:HAD family hydrolase [Eubacterium sp.]